MTFVEIVTLLPSPHEGLPVRFLLGWHDVCGVAIKKRGTRMNETGMHSLLGGGGGGVMMVADGGPVVTCHTHTQRTITVTLGTYNVIVNKVHFSFTHFLDA